MHIVIDGYNFIYTAGGTTPRGRHPSPRPPHAHQDQDQLREHLISQLASYRDYQLLTPPRNHSAQRQPRSLRITVVFDSHPRGRPYPVTEEHLGIEVLYSGPGVEADETVKDMVRRSDHRRDMLVVTSDVSLQTVCRRLGAQVTDSASFRGRLLRQLRRARAAESTEPLAKEEGVPESEVEGWLQDLGLGDESPTQEGPQ